MNEWENSQQEKERTRDNELSTLSNERKAAQKEHMETPKEPEKLWRARKEVVAICKGLKAERNGASKRYHQVFLSVRQIVRAWDKRN